MQTRFVRLAKQALLGGGALFGLGLGFILPANAAPVALSGLGTGHASLVEQARIYTRGRPPIYPYYYRKAPPGGWDFYLGFVPYAKGDYGTQALQRSMYPQDIEWPKSMRPYGPIPGR
jgi:hypothetical protein